MVLISGCDTGPTGDFATENDYRLDKCISKCHKAEKSDSNSEDLLDEALYGQSDIHLKKLNLIRKKLRLIEIGDSFSISEISESNTSPTTSPTEYIHENRPVIEPNVVVKNAFHKPFREVQSSNSTSPELISNYSHNKSTNTHLVKKGQACSWSMTIQNNIEATTNKKLQSSSTQTSLSYLPPHKKVCLRSTTTDSFEKQRGSCSVSPSSNVLKLRLGSSVLSSPLREESDTQTEVTSCTVLISRSNLSSSSSFVQLYENERLPYPSELNLNLPQSTSDECSCTSVARTVTTICTDKDNIPLKVNFCGFDTVQSSEDDVTLKSFSKETASDRSPETKLFDENVTMTQTTEIDCTMKKQQKLYPVLDPTFTSSLAVPVKSKTVYNFPTISRITSFARNSGLNISPPNCGRPNSQSSFSDLDRGDADCAKHSRCFIEVGENFSSYKEVAGKLIALSYNEMKEAGDRADEELNHCLFNAGSQALDVRTKLPGADHGSLPSRILQFRRAQSTEIAFYSVQTRPPSAEDINVLKDLSDDEKSETDSDMFCTPCSCWRLMFPKRKLRPFLT